MEAEESQAAPRDFSGHTCVRTLKNIAIMSTRFPKAMDFTFAQVAFYWRLYNEELELEDLRKASSSRMARLDTKDWKKYVESLS